MPVRLPRVLAGALVASCLVVGLSAATAAVAATPVPRVPAGLTTAIEPLADYVPQTSCDPTVKPGTLELAQLLTSTYAGTTFGSAYACGTDGSVSEHYEGRAIDWMVSIRNKSQHADALAVINWLLATDARGNRFAMARRLGVMYLIYDNLMWGAWDGTWQAYDNCAKTPQPSDDNACHRNHMHISLSWNGAMGTTSFWTNKVVSTDWGPCRARDLNWAPRRTARNAVPCGQYPTVEPAPHATSVKRALVTWSGAYAHWGATGPVVTAVQRALHVSATGTYAGTTRAAVKSFQAHHALPETGAMNQTTWRALLTAVT
jgi:peptidoglycan hydrolase-like protein with peptidoglycan-binding domain